MTIRSILLYNPQNFPSRLASRYTSRLKLTWLALVEFGPSIPQKELARILGISERHLRRWLNRLEELGLLVVRRTVPGRGNHYLLPDFLLKEIR